MNELDPSRDPDALLAHAAWMRRFATALAGADGEDLAQDAWVRVLTRPLPALERPRAWLASALRNAARSRARGEARRAQREAAHAGEPAEPSGAELVARAELEQLAVRTVLALDEPYREALLMRYLRGLEPAEIAQRQGVPASTVRNRIARGLELVRTKLDANHAGRREAWLALIVPFERGFAPATTLAGGTAAGVAAGGALLATKWIVGGVAAALAAVLWWNRGSSERERALEETPTVVSATAPLAPEAPAASAKDEPKATESARTPVSPVGGTSSQPLQASASLDVHVTFARDGSPAAGCEVEVLSWDAPEHPRPRTALTDAAGRVRFTGLEPGKQVVEERRADGEWVEVAAGETLALELVIPLGVDVDLRVVDAEGAPASQARVWLSEYGNGSEGGFVGHTGPDGRLLVRDVGPGRSLAAFADGHVPSAQRDVRGNPGDRVELALALRGPGAALAGRALGPDGLPLAGAEVLVGFDGTTSLHMPDGEWLTSPPPVRLVSDENGRFAARGLEPGSTTVSVRAPGCALREARVPLVAGETAELELTLRAECRVLGTVRDGEGRPLAGVDVMRGRYMDFGWVRAVSREDGSYELGGLAAGRQELRAVNEELGKATTTLQLAEGAPTSWDPILVAGRAITGRIEDERGEPLADWRIAAVEPERVGLWLRSADSGADGRFVLANCPSVAFVLTVRSPDEIFGAPAVLVEELPADGEELLVRVPDSAWPTAHLAGRVRASDGRALVQAQVAYAAEPEQGGIGVFPDAQGSFRIGPLRPGSYRLWLEAEGLGRRELRDLTVAPGQTLDLGWITLEPAARIAVRLRMPEGVAAPDRMQTQALRDGTYADGIELLGLEGRSGPLDPGHYVLRTRAWTWYAPDVELELAPGETRTVELAPVPATYRLLHFPPPAEAMVSTLALIVHDESGAIVCDSDGFSLHEGAFKTGIGGLLPGHYTFEARTSTGLTASGSFDVLDLTPRNDALEFALR